jgi:hypothetical protein
VREFQQELGLSLDRTRDRFIWAALLMGEVGPLVCFLAMGYVPGLAVRQHVALMMLPNEGVPPTRRQPLEYRFEIKSRSGKRGPRRGSFFKWLRDRKCAERVKELMKGYGPGSYDAAVRQIALDTGLSKPTIRNAYDKRSSK